MSNSTHKLRRPQTAVADRCPAAAAESKSPRPSSHRTPSPPPRHRRRRHHRHPTTERSTGPERPPVPAWMLDTPLYSKVPLVAAPAGRIMLYTTGLCEKLHVAPRGFDFDSSPQGLGMTYRSLHDPNLKSYYTTPRMYSHLMRSGFLTPCGMVKCSLKEFNDYHQNLKQVQLKRLTQERKRMMKNQCDHSAQPSHHKSTHEKRAVSQRVGATSSRHQRTRPTRSVSRPPGQVETGGGSKLSTAKGSPAKSEQPADRVTPAHQREEKPHTHKKSRGNREMKAYERQSLLLSKRFDEEMRREQQLERRKLVKMAERELKLQEQWDRREGNRNARLALEGSQRKKDEARASKVKVMRSKMVEAHQARQKAIFESIRDARARLVAQREAMIARRLEKRLGKIRRKYNRRYRRQWAALKHLIAPQGGDEFADDEQKLSSEDEMYSPDDIAAAIERTARYLSCGSLREWVSPPNISSSPSEDITISPAKRKKPELTITDNVLSVTSLDYRRSPNPKQLPKEEPGAASMMRDVYLAEDSGKEDGNGQGPGAASPGIPAISSGMGLADELREGSEAGTSSESDYSSSSASVKSPSRSSSDKSARDKSLDDEESAIRGGKTQGRDSEDETSGEESEAPSEDASEEESDFWKSVSDASLREVSQSVSEEERAEGSVCEDGREEDLVEKTLEAREAKDKDESKAVTDAKMEATVTVDEAGLEKQETESKKLAMKQEAAEERPHTDLEQVADTEEMPEGADGDKLETEKKDGEETLKAAEGDEDDIEVLGVVEENPEAEKKVHQDILEEQHAFLTTAEKDTGIGTEAEEILDADQIPSEEIEREDRETGGIVENEISATEAELIKETLRQKQEMQAEGQTVDRKMEDDQQGETVEDFAMKHNKDNAEKQEETETERDDEAEIREEFVDDRNASDEVKAKEDQVDLENQVSTRDESTTKIEGADTKEDELAQAEAGEVKVEATQIIRQASEFVARVMDLSMGQLSTTGHEERDMSQEASGPSGMQGNTEKRGKTAELSSDSILLANVMNILEAVEHEIHHHHHHHDGHHHKHHGHPPRDETRAAEDEQQDGDYGEILSDSGSECDSCSSSSSSSSNSDEEEGEIIGVVENEIIAVEGSVTSLKGCLSGEAVPGLQEVVRETEDRRVIFEGALMPPKHHSSTSTASSKVSISVTAAVLSAGSLKMDSSGRLKHDTASHSHTKPELKSSATDIPVDTAHPAEPDEEALTESSHHHYTNIVPVYHDNLINVGEELIDANLSAISMKPDRHHKAPSSYSTGSRNSFRNIFRPDMTYCQGSAKCLKDTLLRELSRSGHSKHSSSDEMDMYYDILEEEQEDVTAHHSGEELVTADESEGVCYLPKRRTYKVHHTTEPAVPEQDEDLNEVPVATEEDKMPAREDSSKVTPPPTQRNVRGDTAPGEAGTEPQALASGDDNKQTRVVGDKTMHGSVHRSHDDGSPDGSCDDRRVVGEGVQPQRTNFEVHADLYRTGSDVTRADGCEDEAKPVEETSGPCEESTSDCDLRVQEAPAEGPAESRPEETAGTAAGQSSNTLSPDAEMQDLGAMSKATDGTVSGQAPGECSDKTGNLGLEEFADWPSGDTPALETEDGDRDLDVMTNGPCEVNSVQDVGTVNEGEARESFLRQDENRDDKQESDPDDIAPSDSRQNHQTPSQEECHNGKGEHESCPIPPDTEDVTVDDVHPDDSCLSENVESSASGASLSSSTTLPISCGEAPESASSDIFGDFDRVTPCPAQLPNAILDPTANSSYAPPAVRSPRDAGSTGTEASCKTRDSPDPEQLRAYRNEPNSPSSSPGSASDIPTVSSHPAAAESKSRSSRGSGRSRMSAVAKKISSVFSLGRKHSSRVHPGVEVEDGGAQRKAGDTDVQENHYKGSS